MSVASILLSMMGACLASGDLAGARSYAGLSAWFDDRQAAR